MNQNPPEGSRIEISDFDGHKLIVIPYGNAGIMRYFIGIFIIFWLGGWFMGYTSAGSQIISGEANAFIIFWLGGWTIGGVFAVYFLYRVFRKSIPEQILLNKPNLMIDTGIPPFKINFSMTNSKEYWKSMFPKRHKLEFHEGQLETLHLRETDSGNRLTIDQGSERYELATGGTEIEREWLHKYLQSNYS